MTDPLAASLIPLLAELGHEVGDPSAPLELSSFEVIVLHGRLEETFDVRIPAAEVTPERFATLTSLAALIRQQERA